MTQIHVVTGQNRNQYRSLLETYHRKRHDVFVGERGWAGLARSDGREIDQYDNEHAVYLMAIDGEKLVGSQRLYPTILPHMISETFMDLVERPLPTGPTTFECTRYFVVRERRMGRTDCRLLASIQQYCLEEGIDSLTAVVETWWLPRWQQSGFNVRPLGLPKMVEGQATLAVCIEVSEASWAHALRVGGLKPSDLVRHGLPDEKAVRHAA